MTPLPPTYPQIILRARQSHLFQEYQKTLALESSSLTDAVVFVQQSWVLFVQDKFLKAFPKTAAVATVPAACLEQPMNSFPQLVTYVEANKSAVSEEVGEKFTMLWTTIQRVHAAIQTTQKLTSTTSTPPLTLAAVQELVGDAGDVLMPYLDKLVGLLHSTGGGRWWCSAADIRSFIHPFARFVHFALIERGVGNGARHLPRAGQPLGTGVHEGYGGVERATARRHDPRVRVRARDCALCQNHRRQWLRVGSMGGVVVVVTTNDDAIRYCSSALLHSYLPPCPPPLLHLLPALPLSVLRQQIRVGGVSVL